MDQAKQENPLVSIIVITYNSSKYVLETLESAKEQTYANIELIISDDCSTDNTVEICREWLEKNDKLFLRTEIITVNENTGIAPNCNRGVKNANGKWIKLIAGDDALECDILEEYLKYIKVNESVSILYSNVRIYRNEFKEENLLPVKELNRLPFNKKETTSQQQFEFLLKSNLVWASTIMIKKSVLEKVGWYDENYPYFEDRPILLAILKAGYKIHYLNIFGAKYRRHSESVQTNNKLFFTKFIEDNQRFFINEYLSYYTPQEQKKMKYNYKKNLFLKKSFDNKTTILVKILNRIL